ncbi:MAG: acyltransferase family protein [Oceanococcus sp.]
MDKQLSVYLDLCRFTAAGLVFIAHVSGFTGGFLWQLGGLGHEAVVFFFVLSGYVIAFVTDGRENSPQIYSVNRFARIYSVALPALFITLLCDLIGREVNAAAYLDLDARLSDPWITFGSALVFLNESWVKHTVFSNMPYWSLGYEVWYYVLFGLIIFVKNRWRWPLIIGCLLLMGLSVVLYLPIWLLGVLCYRLSQKLQLSHRAAMLLFVSSVLVLAALFFESNQEVINAWAHHIVGDQFVSWLFEPAEQFAADYLMAVAIAVNILSFGVIGKSLNLFGERFSGWIRYFASFTFSLYLFHMPLLFMWSAFFPWQDSRALAIVFCLLVTPVMIWLIALVTEQRKAGIKGFLLKRVNALQHS